MHQNTFDAFARRAAGLRDRRSLLGSLSAAFFTITSIPLSTEAKKHHHNHGHNHNNKSKACKKRVKDCRAEAGCKPDCPDFVGKCCKKACKSVEAARECIEENT